MQSWLEGVFLELQYANNHFRANSLLYSLPYSIKKKDLPCFEEVFVSDKERDRQTDGIIQGKSRVGIN